jgi:hypothetical protein
MEGGEVGRLSGGMDFASRTLTQGLMPLWRLHHIPCYSHAGRLVDCRRPSRLLSTSV